jgi:hypothetical protein
MRPVCLDDLKKKSTDDDTDAQKDQNTPTYVV